MKKKTEIMYSEMKPWRLFFVVALPGMVSMFAMSVYSIIEGAFIGQKLGESAFAAINIAMPLVMINFSLSDLIGVGGSVPISISLGKKDEDCANNIFSCSLIMIFFSAVIMGSIMFFAAEPLARMMGADDVLLDTSVRYLRTFALTGPLTTVFFAMDNYLRISGFVKTSMVINIVMNISTIILLTFFLLILEMDVVGSALATSISMCLCSVAAMLPFLKKKTVLKFVKPVFSRAMIKEIAACGAPVFLSNISGRIMSIFLNIALMTLGVRYIGENGGQTAVAVYAVLMYSSDLCWPLLYGISDSLAPAIGYNWGAEDYKRVKKIVKCNYIGTFTVGMISTAALYFLASPLAALFSNAEDIRLLSMSESAIKLFCLTYLFRWFSVTTQGFLSAIEKNVQATMMSVSVAFVFPAVVLAALWNLGLNGIWLNMFGTSVLSGIFGIVLLIILSKEIKKRERTLNSIKNKAT